MIYSLSLLRLLTMLISLGQIAIALSRLDDWSFDVLHLADLTGGHPLSAMGFALLKSSGVVAKLRLNETKLARCAARGGVWANNSACLVCKPQPVRQTRDWGVLVFGGREGGGKSKQ